MASACSCSDLDEVSCSERQDIDQQQLLTVREYWLVDLIKKLWSLQDLYALNSNSRILFASSLPNHTFASQPMQITCDSPRFTLWISSLFSHQVPMFVDAIFVWFHQSWISSFLLCSVSAPSTWLEQPSRTSGSASRFQQKSCLTVDPCLPVAEL